MASGRSDKRVGLIAILALCVLGRASAAEPQEAGRQYQVGLVTLATSPSGGGLWSGLIEAMRELNYMEGRNLVVRRASAEGKPDRLPGLVAELVKSQVDVLVTTATRETVAAKRATSTIPIVMTLVPDPVALGVVASLARPGGNVTGLTNLVPGLSQKYVELLREVTPSASRFAVVAGLGGPASGIRDDLQIAARQLGVTLAFVQVNDPDNFDPSLARAKKNGAQGIVVPVDVVTYSNRRKLVALANKHRLPGIYWAREYVEDGGLMTYAASLYEVGRRAAYFVDRILKGAKPAELPVEQPTKFELIINLKTAKALGLAIPPALLVRADQLIE